jgi:hypothetical protein
MAATLPVVKPASAPTTELVELAEQSFAVEDELSSRARTNESGRGEAQEHLLSPGDRRWSDQEPRLLAL